MIKVKWGEDDKFEAFYGGEPEDIPEFARNGGGSSCAVLSRFMSEHLEAPVWMHPVTAFELAEAGVLIYQGETQFGDVTVFLYDVDGG